jgi:hypothetical protein
MLSSLGAAAVAHGSPACRLQGPQRCVLPSRPLASELQLNRRSQGAAPHHSAPDRRRWPQQVSSAVGSCCGAQILMACNVIQCLCRLVPACRAARFECRAVLRQQPSSQTAGQGRRPPSGACCAATCVRCSTSRCGSPIRAAGCTALLASVSNSTRSGRSAGAQFRTCCQSPAVLSRGCDVCAPCLGIDQCPS